MKKVNLFVRFLPANGGEIVVKNQAFFKDVSYIFLRFRWGKNVSNTTFLNDFFYTN
ncbi:MAG: hypothetical protein LBR79_01075 [Oscillospiraceae bacterium]|nr:hypothetical protein [Oscillospiraceae bacterium]